MCCGANYIKRPWRPQKRTKFDFDCRSFSWWRKSPSKHWDNLRISWRRLDYHYQSLQSRHTFMNPSLQHATRCKLLVTFENRTRRLDPDGNHPKKKLPSSRIRFFGQKKKRLTEFLFKWERKVWTRKGTVYDLKPSTCQTWFG